MHHLPHVKHALSNRGLPRGNSSGVADKAVQPPLQGLQTVTEPTQHQPANMQPFVRRSRFEVEPAAFALALIAVVASISLWNPAPSAEQFAPAEAMRTVAQAPSR